MIFVVISLYRLARPQPEGAREVYLDIADLGKPVRRSGYTLTILRKERDGRWRLARDANLLAAEQ